MNVTVTNDGMASDISVKSSSLIEPIIKTPTKISAGAVAAPGTMPTIDARNSSDVTREVSPVRPPSAIPVLDSTNVVAVDEPRHAPTVVASASAIIA